MYARYLLDVELIHGFLGWSCVSIQLLPRSSSHERGDSPVASSLEAIWPLMDGYMRTNFDGFLLHILILMRVRTPNPIRTSTNLPYPQT